jgi:D-proline reductase (dithiol) PrdB
MVRLSDLPHDEQAHLTGKALPPLRPPVWTTPIEPLKNMRLALITTAGLHLRGDPLFEFADGTYRPIPNNTAPGDIIMSHSSVNFDRTGFSEDINLVFPVDRFRELLDQGMVGSLADFHYSFMGAGLEPQAFEKGAAQVAGLLKQDQVDAAFLTPV